jgi:hypothetical protein
MTSFVFPNVFFRSVAYIYYNGKNSLIGYAVNDNILKYFFIRLRVNGTLVNNIVFFKNSSYGRITNIGKVDYVVVNDLYYLQLGTISVTGTTERRVIQTTSRFQIHPHASVGSDPHFYPLFSKSFDMKRLSTNKWYSLFEMNSIKIKGKFVGLKNGIFLHRIHIEDKDKSIKVDFNKKNIKGDKRKDKGNLNIKYENLTTDKRYGKYLDIKKLNILQLNELNYPLSLYIDMFTRYIHFHFEDSIPPKELCSGLMV